jgi:hypothetical protein
VPGAPVTFAGGAREKRWKQAVEAAVPLAISDTQFTGLAINFAIPDARKQDLDNLSEPVLSVVVNRLGWFAGRRPNLQWLALRKAVAHELGCWISPLSSPPVDWLPAHEMMVDETYAALLPSSATTPGLAEWIDKRCRSAGDCRYAVRLRFGDRLNLGDVATGVVKPIIDCMWPIWGGSAKAPDDWRVDQLLLQRECDEVPPGAVGIRVWSL